MADENGAVVISGEIVDRVGGKKGLATFAAALFGDWFGSVGGNIGSRGILIASEEEQASGGEEKAERSVHRGMIHGMAGRARTQSIMNSPVRSSIRIPRPG